MGFIIAIYVFLIWEVISGFAAIWKTEYWPGTDKRITLKAKVIETVTLAALLVFMIVMASI